MKELFEIQQSLKAPKGQKNDFGHYNYRSCEDILLAVKPILKEQKCVLMLDSDIVMIGSRYYIKATATLTNESGEKVVNNAFAREEEAKKGMDSSQVTGAALSYARKYALAGMFAIDNEKDSDATNDGDDGLSLALQEVKETKDKAALVSVYNRWSGFQSNQKFINAIKKRREEIPT